MKDRQGAAVVRVSVKGDHVRFGVDPQHRVGRVLHSLEQVGHFIESVDEDKTANLGELRGDRVHQVQRETGEGRDRPRHVGDDEDLRLGRPRRLETQIERDATGRETATNGVAKIDRSAATASPFSREANRQLSTERSQRPLQLGHLVAVRVHDVQVLGQGFAHGLGQGLGSELNGLDPFLVASLIRQESEFNAGALSRANAVGADAVAAETARTVAQTSED